MDNLSALKKKKTPLTRKLFLYMFALVAAISAFIAIGLYFLGNIASPKKTVADDLNFQATVYYNQTEVYFDDLAVSAATLSKGATEIISEYLSENSIALSNVNDSETHVYGLQKALFLHLKEETLKSRSSGAFIMLDATVNSSVENFERSRAGLYFQRATLDKTDETLLLYRGSASLGKNSGVMPHRKWRLEFNADNMPAYPDIYNAARTASGDYFCLSDVFTLPSTSERAMLFLTPLKGESGEFYGVCGFEIGENYYKTNFAQPTQINRLTCAFLKSESGFSDMSKGFAAGDCNGYFSPIKNVSSTRDLGEGLIELKGETDFVCVVKNITVPLNSGYIIATAVPKSEYNKAVIGGRVKIIALIALILTAAVLFSIIFSRKFLSPLYSAIEKIRRQEHACSSSDLLEIDDLFAFLAAQDKLADEKLNDLKKICAEREEDLKSAKAEVERLAYSRKTEVDPDDYEAFKQGIKSLTKTEKTVFKHYLDGKSAKEIMEIMCVRESTLKYHNHNIIGKLGVSSRKQMLRFAALLKQENGLNL